MNGYSKIRLVGNNKSKSIDFSDLFSPPKTPKSISDQKAQQSIPAKQATTDSNFSDDDDDDSRSRGNTTHDLFSVPEKSEEDGSAGERFGVILSRNCSVSAISSKRFKMENNNNNNNDKQSSAVIQSAVRRAFSMRRSCSVSEGYCRIYDQTVSSPTTDADDAHDLTNAHARSNVKKTKRGKILRACKRLFGFH